MAGKRVKAANDEGLENLMNAVVLQAVKDYGTALYRYHIVHNPEKKRMCLDTVRECEVFFRRDLSAYSAVDGEKIIEKVRDDTEKKLGKKGVVMEI